MKTAEEILSKYHYQRGNPEIDFDLLVTIINDAKIDALNSACNVVKTYKAGNGGSWMDAAIDRSPIIELIKQCHHGSFYRSIEKHLLGVFVFAKPSKKKFNYKRL